MLLLDQMHVLKRDKLLRPEAANLDALMDQGADRVFLAEGFALVHWAVA